jgi:hypothetical protein
LRHDVIDAAHARVGLAQARPVILSEAKDLSLASARCPAAAVVGTACPARVLQGSGRFLGRRSQWRVKSVSGADIFDRYD